MSKQETGGAAFPHPEHNSISKPYIRIEAGQGMTMRDYMATAAMQALIGAVGSLGHTHFEDERVANNAYAMADAMLVERKKEVAQPEPSLAEKEVAKIKEIVRRVIADPQTRLHGPDGVMLMCWAHDFKAKGVVA